MADEDLKFQKQKLPSYGLMGPVAFQAADQQLASSGARVILAGGQRRGITGEMWCYETNGDGWMQVMPEQLGGVVPSERTQASLVSIGVEPQTALLLFAGYVLNVGEANDLWRSEISADPNTSMPVANHEQLEASGELPPKRYGHSATIVGERNMVVFGGQSGSQQFSDLWSLMLEGFAWAAVRTEGVPPSPRMRHAASLAGIGVVLVLGGFNRLERALPDAYMLSLSADGASGSWAPFEVSEGQLPPARAQHTATPTADGKHIFVFGGYDGTKNLADLWIIDVAGRAATEVRWGRMAFCLWHGEV